MPIRPFLIGFPAAGLVLGFVLRATGRDQWSDLVWAIATIPVLLALFVEIVRRVWRGEFGLDIVAALSMTSALAIGQNLAAVVVALMYAGGQYLEDFAEGHARREMTALLSRAPRTAMRHRDHLLEEIDVDLIAVGDRLLIRQGEIVPADGTLASGIAVLDQSALTGESLPVQLKAGEDVMSGSTNSGEAFDIVASHPAAQSTYAGIVRLVEAAQRSKAPMVRLADRYALVFLVATLVIAGGAWAWTQDPIRMVAVLVVATPCPLILAVPVAIVAGLSRAAHHGILIKGGKALETMARIRSLVVDKTGTLTDGKARVVAIHSADGFSDDDVIRIAASLDQASQHVIAQALVIEAQQRRLALVVPGQTVEVPGEGISGTVEGRSAAVGGVGYVRAQLANSGEGPAAAPDGEAPGAVVVWLAVEGRLAGRIVLADQLRGGMAALLARLRVLDVERIVLATGDRRDVADAVTAGLGLDAVRAELTPDQKVMVVLSERKQGPVMMIGDGVNDAPALAAADVGVAMGAKGAAASAEAADAVLLVDGLDRIVPAIEIARRTRFIALESVYVGIGLSTLGMIAAAFGYLTPVQGAMLQEVIDVAVILNALRVLRGG
ncbi:heavy metal translocating P-type ATPase [Bradyrhizobium diazoefficiens]|nr:heavy metal translocating P-type ATPase [Bradyrhizobium diazoefficiens]MBR0981644.1 heavy metal translocating P-type ATPase [Bradyrhizobium diazoefficiens]MBR1011097.1 heavy metal translocating P-type ATPase [Bradyrhizobium diazoefficiens]MBR1017597.1 heavy metal translocating P-type ATPase [Bradyrhizobium diazoefficiens]MBR1054994.1 heavy metal translocating P-type ATPase [Bradyrhizobium diazoefficiens]